MKLNVKNIIFIFLYFIGLGIAAISFINSYYPLNIKLLDYIAEVISKYSKFSTGLLCILIWIVFALGKFITDNKDKIFNDEQERRFDTELLKSILSLGSPTEIFKSLDNLIDNNTINGLMFKFIAEFPRTLSDPTKSFHTKRLEKSRKKIETDLGILAYWVMSSVRKTTYGQLEGGDNVDKEKFNKIIMQLRRDEELRSETPNPKKLANSIKAHYHNILVQSKKMSLV